MKVLLKAAFDTASGYGNDGCGLAKALDDLGVDVMLFPCGVAPPIPLEVAKLLTKPYEMPFDATVVHVDPLNLNVDKGTRRVSHTVIGWSMWEWEPQAETHLGIIAKGAGNIRKNLKEFDLLLSYDSVSEKAIMSRAPKDLPHKILQGGYWSDRWEFNPHRDWSGTFKFIMVGQLHSRKQPFAAIRSFNKLKQKHGDAFDAELHLKTNVLGLHPAIEDAYDGIKIHYRVWSHEEMQEFYDSAHCLLAPSKGEGKNVPALEAQTTGIPVIASNFGGHTVWLNEDYSYPLDIERVEDDGGICAKVDEDKMADLMWQVYSNREEAKRKGEIAARTIPAMCDWSQVAKKLIQVIQHAPQRDISVALDDD